MLRELSVQNLALIEDVRVELSAGYCAWTGETGAGKSLLLTALGLVLGGKSSGDLVRHGKGEARASAVFELSDPVLRAEVEALLPGPLEDDQLILTRRVSSQGRSACHANEVPVTVATLRNLGHRLIDIHSQHEGRALVDPEHQRGLLDAYGKHQGPLDAYGEARGSFDALLGRRRELIEGAERRERELEMLRFEVEDLRAAGPRRGEFEELGREASRLASAENLREAAEAGYKLLYEDDRSAQELLSRVARKLEPLGDAVPAFADAAGELERLSDETREVAYALRRLGEDFADDPDRLEEVEGRLALYRKLTGRYRCEADALEDRLARAEARLAELEVESTALDSLDAPLAEAWGALRGAADRLSRARGESALRMSAELQQQLRRVSLEHAKIEVSLSRDELPESPPDESPPEHGLDRVEFEFASNPGEPARPLRKVASGGELSRVTLAIKTVLAGVDRTPTLVFDEIDTGVGGRLGAALGRNLAELAGHHQVICITHLPQMACHADRQWVIRKRTEGGRTRTTVRLLDERERIEEIAAMLRGDSADDGTRQEAESMLREARESGRRRECQPLSKARR